MKLIQQYNKGLRAGISVNRHNPFPGKKINCFMGEVYNLKLLWVGKQKGMREDFIFYLQRTFENYLQICGTLHSARGGNH